MSIQIPITRPEMLKLERQLSKKTDILCLDKLTYIKVLLIANHRVSIGKPVNAKIVKAFDGGVMEVSK